MGQNKRGLGGLSKQNRAIGKARARNGNAAVLQIVKKARQTALAAKQAAEEAARLIGANKSPRSSLRSSRGVGNARINTARSRRGNAVTVYSPSQRRPQQDARQLLGGVRRGRRMTRGRGGAMNPRGRAGGAMNPRGRAGGALGGGSRRRGQSNVTQQYLAQARALIRATSEANAAPQFSGRRGRGQARGSFRKGARNASRGRGRFLDRTLHY